MAILGKLVDMNFKFVLPNSYINFDIQANFEVNQTKINVKNFEPIIQKKPGFFLEFGL